MPTPHDIGWTDPPIQKNPARQVSQTSVGLQYVPPEQVGLHADRILSTKQYTSNSKRVLCTEHDMAVFAHERISLRALYSIHSKPALRLYQRTRRRKIVRNVPSWCAIVKPGAMSAISRPKRLASYYSYNLWKRLGSRHEETRVRRSTLGGVVSNPTDPDKIHRSENQLAQSVLGSKTNSHVLLKTV